jgi:hypothetical protein
MAHYIAYRLSFVSSNLYHTGRFRAMLLTQFGGSVIEHVAYAI